MWMAVASTSRPRLTQVKKVPIVGSTCQTSKRDSPIRQIRALTTKTVEHGCTEEEMLAALDKAQALIDAYEVTQDELQLSKDVHRLRTRLHLPQFGID